MSFRAMKRVFFKFFLAKHIDNSGPKNVADTKIFFSGVNKIELDTDNQ
jgi:hypothetical protein